MLKIGLHIKPSGCISAILKPDTRYRPCQKNGGRDFANFLQPQARMKGIKKFSDIQRKDQVTAFVSLGNHFQLDCSLAGAFSAVTWSTENRSTHQEGDSVGSLEIVFLCGCCPLNCNLPLFLLPDPVSIDRTDTQERFSTTQSIFSLCCFYSYRFSSSIEELTILLEILAYLPEEVSLFFCLLHLIACVLFFIQNSGICH